MKKSLAPVDYSRMMARYAETKNASQVGEEFGMSRYQVKRRWEALPEVERHQYENQIEQKREEAVREYAEAAKEDLRDMVERSVAVKNALLSKLESCVKHLSADNPMSIGQINNAATALKTLLSIEGEDPDKNKPSFIETIAKQQRIQS